MTKTVVLIDDEEQITELLKTLIEDEGHIVHSFECPAKAMEFFKNNFRDIDVVLTDYHIKNVNGLELVRKMVLLSGSTRFAILTGDLDFEPNSDQITVLYKPFSFDILFKFLDH
jgi:DNA-binding NtrC family response regulator